MSFFSRLFRLSVLLFASCPFAQAQSPKEILEPYGMVLKSYVDNKGLVDYQGLKAHREKLDQAVEALGNLDPQWFKNWSEADKIALYLNAYNLFTLQTIVDHYPVKSIKDIPGAWNRITHLVLGEKLTLDHIEHDILREQYKEPRIHFALVCASLGCPYLRQEPYKGKKLDKQLEDQVRRFLRNPAKFRMDATQGKVYLSAIFKWFGGDFESEHGKYCLFGRYDSRDAAILNFISCYLMSFDRKTLLSRHYAIEYIPYDWSLNDQGIPR